MTDIGARYALLGKLSDQSSSEDRRQLLRTVTEALSNPGNPPSDQDFADLDGVLSKVAAEYSVQARTEFARIVAASAVRFCESAEQFAQDEIVVAGPVLKHSQTLSDQVLLKVVEQKSQAHMMAITQRMAISPIISHALVERGDDAVVTSLLSNERAQIADQTFEVVARRAETSPALQRPLVGRKGVPMDLLNDLYMKVEKDVRSDIVKKFDQVSPAELEKAFERTRSRLTTTYRATPDDLPAAQARITAMEKSRQLVPATLATLLREGKPARTAFTLALARLADVDFEAAERCVEGSDLDTLALLCRGAGFDRALFVTLALGLVAGDKGLGAADAFGKLYESVPVQAAQRALRFWKVRAA